MGRNLNSWRMWLDLVEMVLTWETEAKLPLELVKAKEKKIVCRRCVCHWVNTESSTLRCICFLSFHWNYRSMITFSLNIIPVFDRESQRKRPWRATIWISIRPWVSVCVNNFFSSKATKQKLMILRICSYPVQMDNITFLKMFLLL